MFRTATIAIVVVSILAASAICVTYTSVKKAREKAANIIVQRSEHLLTERQQWMSVGSRSFANAGSQEEALRTLDMLQDLYAQEQRLWDYYNALDNQLKIRSRLAEERAALEQRVNNHENRLRDLDASVEQLRPPENLSDKINFSKP